jgi:hypothetical protein
MSLKRERRKLQRRQHNKSEINNKTFFLNNQPDALIIQLYSVIKLYMFWAEKMPETCRVL